MKKLCMMITVAATMFACGPKTETGKAVDSTSDALGGTMTSLDDKSKAIEAQLKAYADQDTTWSGDAFADNIQVYYPSDTLVDIKDKKGIVAKATSILTAKGFKVK